jgi:hypothetical protein
MAYDTKLRLEGILRLCKDRSAYRHEDVIFTRLEGGPHHDGLRFANGAEVALQKLGPGVKAYIYDALLSPLWKAESAEVVEQTRTLLRVRVRQGLKMLIGLEGAHASFA